jgi:hypothetical protein
MKEEGSSLLQPEAADKSEIIDIADCMRTKHK